VAFLAVGVASRLLWIGAPSNSPPSEEVENSSTSDSPSLPPQASDQPIFALEPPAPASERLPLSLPDLSGVDRRVIEPPGLVRPRYCLLVFGPQARTRVWLVEAGETLYVDRNANGDLTDAGEAFLPSERQGMRTLVNEGTEAEYRSLTYAVGDIRPGDAAEKHTGFKLVRYQIGDRPAEYVVSVWVGGVTLQYAGWGPLFRESRDTAPVIHFGGPVVAKHLRGSTLRRGADRQELHFCIGTPGIGKHSFAYVGYEAVPTSVRPVAEVAWPTGAAVLQERFVLARRC
jgi:hypothetical protein